MNLLQMLRQVVLSHPAMPSSPTASGYTTFKRLDSSMRLFVSIKLIDPTIDPGASRKMACKNT